MTNADKFLKNGVSADKFIEDMFSHEHIEVFGGIKYINRGAMKYWLEKECKPTLTEDERVILRNIKNSRYEYTHIARTQADSEGNSDLYIFNVDDKVACDNILCFDHLFQFIKERRRIRDKGVTK